MWHTQNMLKTWRLCIAQVTFSEMNELINQVRRYPLIYRQNANDQHLFSGILQIYDIDYEIQIDVPHYPTCASMKIRTVPPIDNLDSILSNFNINSLSLESMLDKLESHLKVVHQAAREVDLSFTTNIVDKYLCLRNDPDLTSVEIVDNFQKIRICVTDQLYDQSNFLSLLISPKSDLFTYDSCSFPTKESAMLFNTQDTLSNYVESLKSISKQFHGTYEALTQLNSLCWVLNSIEEKRNLNYFKRRIVLVLDDDNFCSIEIDLMPLRSGNRPDISFFGNDDTITKYQEVYETNLHAWDNDDNIIANLLRVFELPFFQAQQHGALSQTSECIINDFECCICFSYRNNSDQMPDIVCKNQKCHKFYHENCLSKWFLQTANYRKYFKHIYGSCPHCKNEIFCRLLD